MKINRYILFPLLFLLGVTFSPAMAGSLPDTGRMTSYTGTAGKSSDYTINPQSYAKPNDSGIHLSAENSNIPDAFPWELFYPAFIRKYGLSGVATTWSAGSPPDLFGYKPFLPDSPWYRDVSADAVDPDSDNIIADIVRDDPGTMLHPDFGSGSDSGQRYGMAYNVVAGKSAAKVNVTIGPEGYADESDPGPADPSLRVPIPIPFPSDVEMEDGYDHHIFILDKDNCWLYEMYHSVELADGWQADQVSVWDLNSNTRRPWVWTSADEAGLSIFAGLVRYDQMRKGLPSGDLGHAVRFTVMANQEAFIPPASHPGGGGSTYTAHSPILGQRFRLKAAWLAAHASEFSPQNQVILRTLAKYGMILADTGGSLFIQGTRDVRWDQDDLGDLLTVPPSAFEVLAHSVEYTRDNYPTGPAPTIASFTASPTAGDGVILAWDVSEASTLIITPDVGPVRGTSIVVYPAAGTTYTIYATNEFGRTTADVTVNN